MSLPRLNLEPRPGRLPLLAGLALALGVYTAPTQAHRTWLLPTTSVIAADDNPVVTVDAAVSEDLFEFDTNPLGTEQLAITAPDGRALQPDSRATSRRRNSIDLSLAQPGTYRFAATSETAMASYQQGGETRRWRGAPERLAVELPADATQVQVTRVQSRAETYITREAPTHSGTAPAEAAPVVAITGAGLELVPLTPPTGLLAGDTSRFRLLLDGQPAALADVTVIRGGNRYRYKLGEIALKTDAEGRFSVRWPEAGRYWLGSSIAERTATGADGRTPPPARRASYSATFEVLPQ